MFCTRLDRPQEGASRVRERSDQTRLRERRGTGASGERPYEGGPTGTTDLFSGCGGGAYRTLPYAATRSSGGKGWRLRVSTQEIGVSA